MQDYIYNSYTDIKISDINFKELSWNKIPYDAMHYSTLYFIMEENISQLDGKSHFIKDVIPCKFHGIFHRHGMADTCAFDIHWVSAIVFKY